VLVRGLRALQRAHEGRLLRHLAMGGAYGPEHQGAPASRERKLRPAQEPSFVASAPPVQAGQDHRVELKTLGAVDGHELDADPGVGVRMGVQALQQGQRRLRVRRVRGRRATGRAAQRDPGVLDPVP